MKPTYLSVLVLAAGVFLSAIFLSKGMAYGLADSFGSVAWSNQVLMKFLLIVLSLLGIKYFLKTSFSDAGFQKPMMKMKKSPIILSGLMLGVCTTALIFFTPAKGMEWVRKLSLPEFLFVIVIWSSLAEEIFIRGLIQSFLTPFKERSLSIGKFSINHSILVSALIFSGMHLSLIFMDIDPYTVVITLMATFLLGIFAGIFRERYQSILPALITHMMFNIGGIFGGIVIGIMYRVITGEFPTP